MTDELKALIEKARNHKTTPKDRRETLISLAYGNDHLSNPSITRQDIIQAYERIMASRRPYD